MIDSEDTLPGAGDGFSQLTHMAHEVANAEVSALQHGDGRRRLLMAAADVQPARHWPLRGALASLTAAVAIAAALLYVWPFGARPLTYEIRGGQRIAANYVDAARDTPASVDFSDGSQIVAAGGSRLRIDATNERGARVFVERGSATAHVTHRAHSSWVFIAGPFDVHITGTRFTLAWDPHEQAIDLTLHEGSVAIDSPLGSTHCVLRAGQRFRASLAAGTMQLDNGDDQTEALPPTSANVTPLDTSGQSKAKHTALHAHAKPSASDLDRANKPSTARREPSQASEPTAPEETSSAHNNGDWPSLVRQGDFAAVVAAATARGIELSLRSASAADVRALADAARYTGHSDLAERSLAALRARFPGTRQSAAAAFLLGRTYEASGGLNDADRFYALYLRESPDGEFAAEALAGHMRSVATLQGPEAAKPIAREYLRRYRAGVHAETARRLAK